MLPAVIAVAVLVAVVAVLAWRGGGLAATRKMLAMAVAPWLALPLADWISAGAVDVDAVGKAVTATLLAVATYYLPNAARADA